MRIKILVQRKRLASTAFVAIHAPEASGVGVEVTCAIIVKAKVGIPLLARVEI